VVLDTISGDAERSREILSIGRAVCRTDGSSLLPALAINVIFMIVSTCLHVSKRTSDMARGRKAKIKYVAEQ
jgi:hypothetical protein